MRGGAFSKGPDARSHGAGRMCLRRVPLIPLFPRHASGGWHLMRARPRDPSLSWGDALSPEWPALNRQHDLPDVGAGFHAGMGGGGFGQREGLVHHRAQLAAFNKRPDRAAQFIGDQGFEFD